MRGKPKLYVAGRHERRKQPVNFHAISLKRLFSGRLIQLAFRIVLNSGDFNFKSFQLIFEFSILSDQFIRTGAMLLSCRLSLVCIKLFDLFFALLKTFGVKSLQFTLQIQRRLDWHLISQQ